MSSSRAYDFTEISSSGSGNPRPEDEGQETILSDVPTQTSYNSRRSDASSLSQHDRELRSFPLAMISKSFFFVACAMFLWLSIDDLYWADEARSIPTSVLQADDDLTWRQFRSRQGGRTVGDSDATGIGYTRESMVGNSPEQYDPNEITWSELRNKNDNNRRNLRLRQQQQQQQQFHRRRQQQDDAGVAFQTPWNQLPFLMQIAAATLGYDENSWDNGLSVFTDTIAWEDLTPEQQEAAIALGYEEYLWNMLRGFTEASSQVQDTTNEANPAASNQDWGQYFWSELPEEIRIEAEKVRRFPCTHLLWLTKPKLIHVFTSLDKAGL